MEKIDIMLDRLSKSKFRSRFYLNKKMKEYVNNRGMDKVRCHAYEIINKRLRPSVIPNDGHQTPMKQVHPVFIAQHACACCCRGCLNKWYKIDMNRELTNDEVDYIVNILMEWIKGECEKKDLF